jgi:hypothetical protein
MRRQLLTIVEQASVAGSAARHEAIKALRPTRNDARLEARWPLRARLTIILVGIGLCDDRVGLTKIGREPT